MLYGYAIEIWIGLKTPPRAVCIQTVHHPSTTTGPRAIDCQAGRDDPEEQENLIQNEPHFCNINE